MYELKRVGVWSCAKKTSVISAFIGLFSGIIFCLISTAMVSAILTFTLNQNIDLGSTTLSGIKPFLWIFGIIGFPIAFAILGLIIGFISALIYNVSSKFTGGIKLEFNENSDSSNR